LPPQRPLGIIHLTANTKNLLGRLRGDSAGRRVSLRFPPTLQA
jgi:hypothetical protein